MTVHPGDLDDPSGTEDLVATDGLTTQTNSCPGCGARVPGSFRYCEACGEPLRPDGGSTGHGGPGPARWLSSSSGRVRCPGCGGATFSAEGFCSGCGQSRPAGSEHCEIDLGVAAGVTDIGHRHRRNEDAMALGTLPGAVLVIVCDGVSSSSRGDAASHAAVDAGMPVLRDEMAGGAPAEAAVSAAAHAARAGVVATSGAGNNPPSCTFVAAVVTDREVTVGWIGDSRAYWLPVDRQPICLTTDDSLAVDLIASGVPPAEAQANPQAGALVRWLGVDGDDGPPKTVTLAPEGLGRVVVCSDGLSRYRSSPAALAEATPHDAPVASARQLVRVALDEGGADNVTVVVVPFPPDEAPQVTTRQADRQPTHPPGWRPPTLPAVPRPPEWRHP